jgi:hypothetical protein
MSVNYIFPQHKKILIIHVCLHPEGMVFSTSKKSSNFWMFSSLNIHFFLKKECHADTSFIHNQIENSSIQRLDET